VSVLDESAPMKFFGPFGFRSGRDIDKFEKATYKNEGTGHQAQGVRDWVSKIDHIGP